MMFLNEGLRSGDLKDLVLDYVSIDEYKSKLGNDEDVIVLAFFVMDEDPAIDLSRFIEKGANKILDTEASPAPNEDGYYMVFVEYPRNETFENEVFDLLDEIKNLVHVEEWRFKPYKFENVIELNKSNLKKHVILDKKKKAKKRPTNESILDFVKPSCLTGCSIRDDVIIFEHYGRQYHYQIIDFADTAPMYEEYMLNDLPIMFNETRWEADRFESTLGGDWSFSQIGDYYVMSRMSDTKTLLLKKGD